MKYKNILITGGAGFVGSNLAISFKRNFNNIEVIALDNLKRRGSELNLPRLKREGVIFIHGDVRNSSDIDIIDKTDLIIECSAEPSVMAGLNGNTDYLIDTNLGGLINCLNYSVKKNSDIIFLSTSRVYPYQVLNKCNYVESEKRFDFSENQEITGVTTKGINEKFPLMGARSLYGATKLASELFIREYAESFGIKTIINRFGCIAGPWQMGKIDQGVMALWVIKHVLKKELKYIGYGGLGKQVRDFIHIEDVFNVLIKQIENIDKLSGKTFNVGGGIENSVSLKELSEVCKKITGNKINISSEQKNRPADLKVYITDNSVIQNTIDWIPQKNIEDIVKDTHEWVIKNQTLLDNILG
ncbi:MAG: NAD-dependent epimerase/dehydratase family protein [Pseudomonadales bacterium]|nr:NAD-dependent epimerase/dehydratase family protein [Pseudomonadales bacterium]